MDKKEVTQKVQQKVQQVTKKAEQNMEKAMNVAEREVAKVKREMDKHYKTVEAYVKKNPEKASLISAGIGAALGASVALLLGTKKKAKQTKKK